MACGGQHTPYEKCCTLSYNFLRLLSLAIIKIFWNNIIIIHNFINNTANMFFFVHNLNNRVGNSSYNKNMCDYKSPHNSIIRLAVINVKKIFVLYSGEILIIIICVSNHSCVILNILSIVHICSCVLFYYADCCNDCMQTYIYRRIIPLHVLVEIVNKC